jgi:16S rRNA (cytosine1402-N4)-methyltransferase
MLQDDFHQPVLLKEAIDALIVNKRGNYVDCTLGGGGHSEEILNRLMKPGKLLCMDADPDAIFYARKRLGKFSNAIIRQVFYDQIEIVLVQEKIFPINGVFFDLGISSFQINKNEKGFSFQEEGPLDMRFNPIQEKNAEKIVNEYSPESLTEIFKKYGEEREAKKIVKEIVCLRQVKRIRTTKELAQVVSSVTKPPYQKKALARIFQAIRIEVNDELNRLQKTLKKAFELLDKHGRMVVISYHSLEDRIVKDFFKYKASDCICPPQFPKCVCDKESELKIITRHPVLPSTAEIKKNFRARSAKMRVAEKKISFRTE